MSAGPSFLSYTPVSLTFGTSGLRGLVADITDLEAYINVKGGLRYLEQAGDVARGAKIVLGGDLRPSTPRIMQAAGRAITDAGFVVENAGMLPTPALMLHSLATRSAGVMVTGSHIPFDRNGIKINKSVGEVLKSDEAGITGEVERIRAEEYARSADEAAFDGHGMLKAPPPLPQVTDAATERYVRRFVDSFGKATLHGLTVLVYEHSAVGRDLVGRILREIGAEVVPAGRAETFIPIDTENVTDELLARLEGLLATAEAAGSSPHVIVSTDGDSDRPLVAAVRPKGESPRVQFLPGDLLGLMAADFLGADAVAVPISSNDAIERRLQQASTRLVKTKIGSPYVVAALADLISERKYRCVVGWEANGGLLVGSEVAVGGAPLVPLPTRDSMLPILANLVAAARAKSSLTALWEKLPARYGRSGLKDQVPVVVSRAILKELVPPGSVMEVTFERGEVHGPVDITLSESDKVAWQQTARSVAAYFTKGLGFGDVVRINILDGVRISFSNGDVAHLRPSGNAPQLRIYANADSERRATEIVELGLEEPNGVLAALARAHA